MQRYRILFLHASFWCVYFSFFYYQISFRKHGAEPEFWELFTNSLYQVGSMMVIAYLNYFVLLPSFLKHKRLGRYLLGFVSIFAVFMFAFLKGKQYMIDGLTYTEKWAYSERFAINHILSALFIVVFVGMLRFAQDWFELEAKKREVENEKLMAELRFLKAQINPHFLFNTLNNLYYLAFTQSPNTTDVIAKLSQMMRYMIYDSNHNRVPLSKEIEYMENYINLEKMRINEPVKIGFDIQGNVLGLEISPLILINFLENAFKHGISANSKDAFISVKIILENKKCTYIVENSKLATSADKEASGIGLQNVKRRLDLSYPNQYELTIKDLNKTYWVELKLELN